MSNADRQRRLAERRAAGGMKAFKVWLSNVTAERLRARFSGAKGGIDWAQVVAAALEHDKGLQAARPSTDPIPYWRPDGKRDTRCQAKNLSGDRCRQAGTVIIRSLDANDRVGEFAVTVHGLALGRPTATAAD